MEKTNPRRKEHPERYLELGRHSGKQLFVFPLVVYGDVVHPCLCCYVELRSFGMALSVGVALKSLTYWHQRSFIKDVLIEVDQAAIKHAAPSIDLPSLLAVCKLVFCSGFSPVSHIDACARWLF